MNFRKLMEEFLKLPTNVDEAIAMVKKNPVLNSTVEEMAFKQTVINVLIAAGLVTENDFNASVSYFKNKLYEDFGKELLKESQKLEDDALNFSGISDPDEEDDEEWLEQDDIPQA